MKEIQIGTNNRTKFYFYSENIVNNTLRSLHFPNVGPILFFR